MNLPIDRKASLLGGDHDDFSMAIQYKKAYEILLRSEQSIDTIAMPILYLIRHYLELLFKVNIKYFSKYSNSEYFLTKLASTHDFKPLKKAFFCHYGLATKNIAMNVGDDEFNLAKNALSLTISELSDIDTFSFSFRYVHDKNDNKNFTEPKYFDFKKFMKNLEEGEKILLYSIDIFENALRHSNSIKL